GNGRKRNTRAVGEQAKTLIIQLCRRTRTAPILSRSHGCPKLFRGLDSARRVELTAGLKALNYLVDAPETDHQRRPRRQDIGAVDFVDLARFHRRAPIPTRAASCRR